MFLIKPRYRRAVCLFVHRLNPRRITPLTWLIWAALVSDLAAPGYLVFHLGVTEVDLKAITSEVVATTTSEGE